MDDKVDYSVEDTVDCIPIKIGNGSYWMTT